METKRSRRIAVKGVLPALKVNEEKMSKCDKKRVSPNTSNQT